MKIVTVETISTVEKHPDADRLHVYTLMDMAWQIVSNVKYNPGDRVAYVHTDTVAPKTEEFKFLESVGYRIKTIKLRGVISNGMLLPLDEKFNKEEFVKTEIGEELGFSKYIKPQPLKLDGDAAGDFPKEVVQQTDEERLQNHPELIEELRLTGVAYATIKHDGSSATYFKDEKNKLRVCSRNLELKENVHNAFWQMAVKYDLDRRLPKGVALQAELVGPKVQKNPEDLKEVELRVFNVWTLEDGKLASLPELDEWCIELRIPSVELFGVYIGAEIPTTIAEYEALSRLVKYGANPGEGLVWRPMYPRWSKTLQKNLSFKVINDEYKD